MLPLGFWFCIHSLPKFTDNWIKDLPFLDNHQVVLTQLSELVIQNLNCSFTKIIDLVINLESLFWIVDSLLAWCKDSVTWIVEKAHINQWENCEAAESQQLSWTFSEIVSCYSLINLQKKKEGEFYVTQVVFSTSFIPTSSWYTTMSEGVCLLRRSYEMDDNSM